MGQFEDFVTIVPLAFRLGVGCEWLRARLCAGVPVAVPGQPLPVRQHAVRKAQQHDGAECVCAHAFLSLCQGNHYQFDSMRRAKHSSMMVLYHLHNPDAPAFSCSCNKCGAEIEPGQGFRCATCQDFDMCAACKNSYGHQHPLVVRALPPLLLLFPSPLTIILFPSHGAGHSHCHCCASCQERQQGCFAGIIAYEWRSNKLLSRATSAS